MDARWNALVEPGCKPNHVLTHRNLPRNQQTQPDRDGSGIADDIGNRLAAAGNDHPGVGR